MGARTWNIVIAICLFAAALPGPAQGSVPPGVLFDYRNGLFSVRGENVPLLPLLETIAARAGVGIYLFGDIPSHVTVALEGRSLESALRSLLRGCSHAVVYDETDPAQRIVFFGPSRASRLAELPEGLGGRLRLSGELEGRERLAALDAPQDRRTALAAEIGQLEERIRSGDSDRVREMWAKVRDPRFLANDRARLESLRKELEELE